MFLNFSIYRHLVLSKGLVCSCFPGNFIHIGTILSDMDSADCWFPVNCTNNTGKLVLWGILLNLPAKNTDIFNKSDYYAYFRVKK